MKRVSIWLLCLALVLVMVTPTTAKALVAAPSPVSLRVANADAVVVGKVTSIEPKTIKAEMFKGDTRDLQVAKVKVTDLILGRGKEIRVAFVAAAAAPGGIGGGRIRPPFRRGGVQLAVGQEACLFATKHPTHKDVYVVQQFGDVIAKAGNANFGAEVDEAKKAAKLLMNPSRGLDSKDPEERLMTAGMLLTRYRTPRGGETKLEDIPAAESKKILTVLAETNWTAPRGPRNFMLNPQGLFFRLGLQAKDGWNQPKDFNQVQTEAKKWLKDNAGKYRVQRYVGTSVPTGDPTEPPASPE